MQKYYFLWKCSSCLRFFLSFFVFIKIFGWRYPTVKAVGTGAEKLGFISVFPVLKTKRALPSPSKEEPGRALFFTLNTHLPQQG